MSTETGGPMPSTANNTEFVQLTQTQYAIAITGFTAFWYFLRLLVQRRVKEFLDKRNMIEGKRRNAFSESAWKLLSFGCLTCMDYYVALEYFAKPLALYDEFPHSPSTATFLVFYLLQLTNYIAAVIQHVDGTEERRKDFLQMLIHHVATIVLIGGSFSVGLFRIGSIVLFFHDSCDVVLESAKMATYAKWKFDEMLWVSLAITWVTMRFYGFGKYVLIPIWTDINYLAENKIVSEDIYYYRRFLIGFIYVIFFLNVFWFSLMVKGIWKVFVQQQKFTGDSRESDHLKNNQDKKKAGDDSDDDDKSD